MNNQPIILERLFNAPVKKVWKALTDRDEMEKWYFNLKEFRPEIGFKFSFTGGPSPEKQYLHLCEITEVIPEKKLTHTWRYDGYPGNSFLNFELTPQGNKTLFKLIHKDLETFPRDNPDLARKNFEEGWNEIINISLKDYLEAKKKIYAG
jgi:uncharacterized protein YndB with AHSA1/START domain